MTHEIQLQYAADELRALQAQREPVQGRVKALLGDGSGRTAGNRGVPWIFARLGGDASQLVEAYNGTPLVPVEGMAVTLLVKYQEGRVAFYEIERLANDVPYVGYIPGQTGGVAAHAASHEGRAGGGWDLVNVYPLNVTMLRADAQATPGLTLAVSSGYYNIDGTLYYYAGGNSIAFTPPGSGGRYDVLTLDTSGNLHIETNALNPGPPVAFTLVAHRLPLVAVLLFAGQTAINSGDLYDVRAFLSLSATGTVTSGAFALTGVLSPPSISSNQNNYNPTGLSSAAVLRLTSSVDVSITGLAGGTSGRLMFVHNVGANTLTLKNASTSSSVSNRFALIADALLLPNAVALLQYDSTNARWRMVGGTSGSSGGSSGSSTLIGLARWLASTAQTLFDLPDIAEYIISITDNGSELDPLVFTLSADGSQVTMDSGITVDHIVVAHYVVAQL